MTLFRNIDVTTGWLPLPAETAKFISILNNTGADLLVAHSTETATARNKITLKDGQSTGAFAVQSTAEVSIKAAAGVEGVQYTIEAV